MTLEYLGKIYLYRNYSAPKKLICANCHAQTNTPPIKAFQIPIRVRNGFYITFLNCSRAGVMFMYSFLYVGVLLPIK